MREILFRGKRKGNSEWVYGWLGHLHCHNPREKTIESIYFTEITEDHNSTMNIIVDYKTVGQYTGLTDKNGKKIFEGDIVQSIELELKGIIVFDEHCRFMIKDFSTGSTYLISYNNDEIQVIGNIHDNPELLKGGEG